MSAIIVISPWSVLEAEDEREEVDEPSHAERTLAPFFLPPLAQPELRPLSRLLRPPLPPQRQPESPPAPDASPPPPPSLPPRDGGGGRHPHHFCSHPRSDHPHEYGPRGRDYRCVAVSPGCVPSTLPPGSARRQGWAPSRGPTAEP